MNMPPIESFHSNAELLGWWILHIMEKLHIFDYRWII